MKWLFQSTAIILTGILNNSQYLTVYIPLLEELIDVNTLASRVCYSEKCGDNIQKTSLSYQAQKDAIPFSSITSIFGINSS